MKSRECSCSSREHKRTSPRQSIMISSEIAIAVIARKHSNSVEREVKVESDLLQLQAVMWNFKRIEKVALKVHLLSDRDLLKFTPFRTLYITLLHRKWNRKRHQSEKVLNTAIRDECQHALKSGNRQASALKGRKGEGGGIFGGLFIANYPRIIRQGWMSLRILVNFLRKLGFLV